VADIFQEVDEEIRRDRFADLWKRYGAFVIAACIAVVVGTGGRVAYREWREASRLELAERYRAAAELAQKNQPAEAAKAFAAIAEDAPGGYGVLARLREAAAHAEAGDRAAALAAYDRLAADSSAEKVYRDLARLHAAMLLADQAPAAEVELRLEPLLAADNPWRHSARELKGLVALREGRANDARQAFQAIVDDATAPGAVRARAQQMLQTTGQG
jgi:hypothetical protein